MKTLVLVLGLVAATAGCARKDSLEIPTGSDVTVQKRDGVSVSGRLVEANASQLVLEGRDGVKTLVPRSQVASVQATTATPAAPLEVRLEAAGRPVPTTGSAAPETPTPDAAAPAPTSIDPRPEYREITLPAGTILPVTLATRVDSDRSHVEDPVRGTLRRAVMSHGVQALPAGTALLGHVTSAREAGKVKGRALIGVRFNQIDLPGAGGRESISTAAVSRLAPATKQKDAARIGVGAGAGAIIGGLLGGKSGAAKGAAVGGGAGTAVVLTTRGNEIGMAAGAPLSIRLTAPLTIRVPMK